MSELPSSWVTAPLSELCNRIVDGSHNPPSATERGKPMLSARNIQQRRILFDSYRLIPDAAFEHEHLRTQASPHDILLTIVGTIGRVAIVQEDTPEFTLQRSVAVLKPNISLTPRFLAYALESPRIQKHLADNAKGTAQKGIYLKALGSLEMEVAPLSEQNRIADKLDAVLARVDACRDRLDHIPVILKRFRQSILVAAVTGRLTADFRNEDEYQLTKFGWEIPESWNIVTINEVAEVKGGKRLPNGKALVSYDTGYPYIRAGQLKNGTVVPDDQLYLTQDVQSQIARYIVNSGDVYITIVGACIGDAGVIPATYEGSNLTENAAKLCNYKKTISGLFLSFWLRSQLLQEIIQSEIKSGAQGKLALMRIKTLPFPYPSIEEQTEIVHRVESLFAYADRIESRYAVARAQVEKLTPALLAKAFRGELVPQDPNDEPASELLERIQAQRGDHEASKSKRSRKVAA